MIDIDEAFRELYEASGRFNTAIDQIPEDNRRFKEAWEYKSKLQSVLGEWFELVDKWSRDDNFPMN